MKKFKYDIMQIARFVLTLVVFIQFSSYEASADCYSMVDDSGYWIYENGEILCSYSDDGVDGPYVNNKNGIITDIGTDLIWQAGYGKSFTWSEACDYCNNLSLGGYNDWELPDIDQLATIINKDYSPAINLNYFSDSADWGTGILSGSWTGSTYSDDTEKAWVITFYGEGIAGTSLKKYKGYVRCVRRNNASEPTPDPLSISITTNKLNGYASLQVSFSPLIEGGVSPYQLVLNFGDGMSSDQFSGLTEEDFLTISHTYSKPGSYQVVLTVQDIMGQTTSSSVTIVVEELSSAELEPLTLSVIVNSQFGYIPFQFSCKALASGGAPPYQFLWDFGDGSTSSFQEIDHIFYDKGEYNALLTVTDLKEESASKEIRVVVEDLEAPVLQVNREGRIITLTWSQVPGAEYYTLYALPYSNSQSQNSQILPFNVGNITSYSFELDGAFYVAVTAHKGSNLSNYSNVEFFSTLPTLTISPNEITCGEKFSLSLTSTGGKWDMIINHIPVEIIDLYTLGTANEAGETYLETTTAHNFFMPLCGQTNSIKFCSHEDPEICTNESNITLVSIGNKEFGDTETDEEMRLRYYNNISFFNENPDYYQWSLNREIVDIVDFTCFEDYSLFCFNELFNKFSLTKAYKMLSNFLNGSGDNINIDIELLFEENPKLKNNISKSIKQSIENDDYAGTFKVNQWDWDGVSKFSDWNLALGTVDINWEVHDDSIFLFINDKYSFDINAYDCGFTDEDKCFRYTVVLYLEAATLVQNGTAKDFFMVGRLQEPLSWLD